MELQLPKKEEVVSVINRLKSLDLKSAEYDEVRKYTDVLVRCGFMGARFLTGLSPIFRGRVVTQEKIWHEVKDISYPPKKEGSPLRYNRLSTNKFEIFYGAVLPQLKSLDQVAAMIEIGSVMEDDFPDEEEEFIEFARWNVIQEFDVAILGLHSKIAEQNSRAQKLKEIHKELSQQLGDKRGELIELVAEFLSHEFSKKVKTDSEWEYKISAAYGDAIFAAGIKAIQFPSVKTEGRSFNIALHKDLVDNKTIACDIAAVSRLRKIKKEVFVDWFLISPTVNGGKFKWETPPSKSVTGTVEFDQIKKFIDRDGEFKFGKPAEDV